MPDRRATGKDGEQRALAFLKRRGFTILTTNYRFKTGEIDIIARKKALIAFIEVKTRLSTRYGYPEEAINKRRQRRMIQTAKHFLVSNKLYDKMDIRFDVLALLRNDTSFKIEYFENAFREER